MTDRLAELISEVEQFRGLVDRLERDQRERGADIMRMQAWANVQNATIIDLDNEIKRLKVANADALTKRDLLGASLKACVRERDESMRALAALIP